MINLLLFVLLAVFNGVSHYSEASDHEFNVDWKPVINRKVN